MRINGKKMFIFKKNILYTVNFGCIDPHAVIHKLFAFGNKDHFNRCNFFQKGRMPLRTIIFKSLMIKRSFFLSGITDIQRRNDNNFIPLSTKLQIISFGEFRGHHSQPAHFHKIRSFGTNHPRPQTYNLGPRCAPKALHFGQILHFMKIFIFRS